MTAATLSYARSTGRPRRLALDPWILGPVAALLLIGLVMVASASIGVSDRELGAPFFYFQRQLMYVGLGSSVQKLFYLPEAHTDFVFAVLAEEFGFVGVVVVLGLFALLVGRALTISRNAAEAGLTFQSYLAAAIGIWLGLQAFVNVGVNMGLLPTKGLTLPLMSYGGSAILVNLVAIAVVLRIDIESRQLMQGGRS